MKKKLSFLLLIVFVIPILAFWGCGSVETYNISASSSDTQFGIVEGQGTYNDGSDITLTATAWSGSNFVAWVFEEKTELVNGDSYSITNTTENDKIVSSTITFKCSKETAGNYTAVFADPAMQYTKLSSWYISKSEDATPESETSLKPIIMQSSMSISQGKSFTTEIYTMDAVDIKENVEISAQINSVLKLAYGEAYQIKIKPRFQIGSTSASPTMNAYITYQNQTPTEETDNQYKVDYSNGVYRIECKVTVSGQDYYVNLLYKNLGK